MQFLASNLVPREIFKNKWWICNSTSKKNVAFTMIIENLMVEWFNFYVHHGRCIHENCEAKGHWKIKMTHVHNTYCLSDWQSANL
jgi:hypothetical protein